MGGGTSGQTTHVVDLAKALRRAGHDVTFLNTLTSTCDQDNRDDHFRSLSEAGVRVVMEDVPKTEPQAVLGEERSSNIVHAHSTLDFGRAASLASALRVPYVLTIHGVGVAGTVASRFVAGAAAVITVGRRGAAEARTMTPRVALIENGVDTERFHPPDTDPGSPAAGSRHGPSVVLSAGRKGSTRRKSFRSLVTAVCGLGRRRPVRLVVLAKSVPSYGETLDRAATPLVNFRGWLAEPSGIFREADVIVGSGRVIREGLASGRPCLLLGPAYCGLIEPGNLNPAFGHDFSGRTASGSHRDAGHILADLELLASDTPLRQRLGEIGRRYAVANLGLERMAYLTVAVYKGAFAGRE